MIKKLDKKLVLRELFMDVFSGVLLAIGIQGFTLNAHFAPGGINGAAIILNYLFHLPIGTLIILLNIPIVLVSFRLIGKNFLLRSLKSMVIGAYIMDWLGLYLPSYSGSPMLAAIFAGIFSGLGFGILFREGTSTGGTDFLIYSAKKLRPDWSLGQIAQIIDDSILILGAFVFGNIDAVLYGLIYTFVSSVVMDRFIGRFDSGKMALIITKYGEEMCTAIDDVCQRGSTRLTAFGGYQGEPKEVVLCVCSRRQLFMVQQAVKDVDEDAFMIVGEFEQVYGNGFRELMKKG